MPNTPRGIIGPLGKGVFPAKPYMIPPNVDFYLAMD
jgi:hypothetical protein